MAENIIDKIKKQMAINKKMMETGELPEEKPVKVQPKKDTSLDMSDVEIKKRDAEYRRKGWIK